MFLKLLRLRQFRNHDRLDLACAPGLNLLTGPNGAGKSNILEALAVLARGESHRGAEARQLPAHDREEWAVDGVFDGEAGVQLEARQKRGRPRAVKLNNAPQKRLRDWIGAVPLVTFCPDDLGLVKGDPAVRRRLVNGVLGQADGAYADAAARYQKVVEERNAALKSVQEGRASRASLEPWDLMLLKEGGALTCARARFLAAFGPRVEDRHRALAGGAERARLAYKPSLLVPGPVDAPDWDGAAVAAQNRLRLMDLRDGEIALGSTLIGPHRDDVEVLVDGRPARGFASQGQQRTLAVAIKLAERAFLKDALGREPIALLDDLMSELDPARRGHLVDALTGAGQVLVAMTSPADWGGPLPAGTAVHRVAASETSLEDASK